MVDKLFTQPEVARMLRRAGLGPRQAKIGAAISMCEAPSYGADEPTADFSLVGDQDLADETWGYSYGGFQIRSLRAQTGTGGYRDAEQLLKPRFNCRAAYEIFVRQGWSAWSTFNSEMYKAYLPDLYPPPENVHVVIAGESLSSIAPKYGLTWEELARLNSLHKPYNIYIGQHLRYREDS
jgi:hypothetical protein